MTASPEPAHRAIARILSTGVASRVRIDLNARVGRRVVAGFEDCDLIPSVGEEVVVYEEESGIEGNAVATSVDEGKRLVYLVVDWNSLREA